MQLKEISDTCRIIGLRLAQDADTCDSDLVQTLDVEVADGGGGAFVRLKTEGWALDGASAGALARLLEKLIEWHDEAEKDEGPAHG